MFEATQVSGLKFESNNLSCVCYVRSYLFVEAPLLALSCVGGWAKENLLKKINK
jgi:hypothetical protein